MENIDNKLTIRKILGHLGVVNRHKFKVFCLCCKAGIPWRGLVHDLSKFTPTEFIESARYFEEGKYSPIKGCKRDMGYSVAWIHHKNHNKHHYEYWYDYDAPIESPVMPFKYFLEHICDSLSAGLTYQGDSWTKDYQLSYWNKVKDRAKTHPKIKELITKIYTDVSKEGINPVLNKKRIKKLYDEYTK